MIQVIETITQSSPSIMKRDLQYLVFVTCILGLVEYFLHKFDLNMITKTSYATIFYTGKPDKEHHAISFFWSTSHTFYNKISGKRDLVVPKNLPVNLFIFRCRPNLEETISGIVTAIDSGEGLPEEMCK